MTPKIMLNLERPIAFFPQLARALGGIEEAIFVQQLYYWSDKGDDSDGWIYKTQKEWEEETTLTRFQQNRIRVKFQKFEILETKLKKANGNPTLFYRLKIPVLLKLLSEKSSKTAFPKARNLHPDMQETYIPICKKLTKPNPTIYSSTEITAETTYIDNYLQISQKTKKDAFVNTQESEIKKATAIPTKFADNPALVNKIFDLFYQNINPAINWSNLTQRKAAVWLIEHLGEKKIINAIQYAISVQAQQYAPVITSPLQLKNKLADLRVYYERANQSSLAII